MGGIMSESQSPTSWGFPKDVVEKLQETALRVTQGVPAFRALKAVLTDEEWRRAEGELARFFPDVLGRPSEQPIRRPAYYAIRKLMELRKISQPRAILELGRALNFLTPPDYERLLRAVGEGERKPKKSKLPVWDREARTLRFEGAVIRTIRSLKVAKHTVAILDTFEGHNWQPRVANPLRETGQMLHDALKSLNKGLKKISFHADGDGQQISWRRR
jgi:hypothetical protein